MTLTTLAACNNFTNLALSPTLGFIARDNRLITRAEYDTALRLGHWFGTSAQFWLNLQTAHDIRVADAQVGAEIKRLPRRRGAGTPARRVG